MKVLMRIKNYCGDKIFLKPLTFEEYQEKVETYLNDIENQVNYFTKYGYPNSGIAHIERISNFFIMPIPASGFQAKSVWINAQNLEKYRI